MNNYLVQHYYDQSAYYFPDKCALKCNSTSLTYKELNNYANRFSRCLLSLNIKRQDRVILYLDRTIFSVIAILGVLKADAIYVPVDSNIPYHRLSAIINDCKPSILVCDPTTIKNLKQFDSTQAVHDIIIALKSDSQINFSIKDTNFIKFDSLNDSHCKAPLYQNIDTDIAYILYTSGSTGVPKGVMITHLNIINYIEWAVSCFGIDKNAKILSTAPFHFDMSTFDIFCAAKSGAQLTIAVNSHMLFPIKLIELIETEQITIWKAVSSLLMYLAKTGSINSSQMPSLNTILFAGEVLATKYIIEWMQTFPNKRFINAYGPTEATGISLYHRLKEIPKTPNDIIPIGKPCNNTEVFLLSHDGSVILDNGQVGELAIRSSGVSPGYWNNKHLTNNAFIYNNLCANNIRIFLTGDLCKRLKDGNFEYIGRKDRQIKYRGYRIELDEIEMALINTNIINDAAVVLVNSNNYDIPELIAFFESNNHNNDFSVKQLASHTLPHYMIPDVFIEIEAIPRNDRGKVNRLYLIEHYQKYLSGNSTQK